jgi:uncharacterized protein YjbI with pentapeptide repeats
MASDEHVALLKQGVTAWNAWRAENPDIRPDPDGANISGADLASADLPADLKTFRANLRANLIDAGLSDSEANLEADLSDANLRTASLLAAELARDRHPEDSTQGTATSRRARPR